MLTERVGEGERGKGMSFCTACGCARTGDNHYCDGCGAAFGEPEDWVGADSSRSAGYSTPETGPGQWGSRAEGWAAPRSADALPSQPGSGPASRPEASIGLLDSLFTAPDPSWDDWYVRPGTEARSPRPAAEEGTPEHQSSVWRKRILIALVAGVIGVAFSGAAAIELGHAHARSGARAAQDRGAAAHPRTPRQSATSASGSANGVAVAPSAAGRTALPRVLALLRRYFSAINGRDYPAYAQLLDAQAVRVSPASAFYSGYGSTIDSDETLTGISATGSGGLAAAVTFTSHQQPADSPDRSACDNWSITLYLVPDGTGYLIGLPPSGYQATYTAC
jgi:hypothetical protein